RSLCRPGQSQMTTDHRNVLHVGIRVLGTPVTGGLRWEHQQQSETLGRIGGPDWRKRIRPRVDCWSFRRRSVQPAIDTAVSWSSTASTVWIVDDAVVVGAGIGGLTASLVLSRVAPRGTLVERAEPPSEVGAALALQPNGMAVLDLLGLLPAVQAVGARIDRMDIRSVTGRRLLTAEMPDLGGGLDHAIAV